MPTCLVQSHYVACAPYCPLPAASQRFGVARRRVTVCIRNASGVTLECLIPHPNYQVKMYKCPSGANWRTFFVGPRTARRGKERSSFPYLQFTVHGPLRTRTLDRVCVTMSEFRPDLGTLPRSIPTCRAGGRCGGTSIEPALRSASKRSRRPPQVVDRRRSRGAESTRGQGSARLRLGGDPIRGAGLPSVQLAEGVAAWLRLRERRRWRACLDIFGSRPLNQTSTNLRI